MQYELLGNILKRKGVTPVSESTSVSKTEKPVRKNQIKSNRLNESDMLHSDVETLVESAVKETLKRTINESAIPDSDKIRNVNVVENIKLKEEESLSFLNDTIDPILETATNGDINRMLRSKNTGKVRSVSLPLYEIALTLESARIGALTEESLEDKSVSDKPGPIVDEVGATAEARAAKKEKMDGVKNISDVVDSSVDQTYNFGELKEIADSDLTDAHQYDKFDAEKEPTAEQKKKHNNEVMVKNGKVEEYEGEEAGDDEENFKTVTEGTVLARLFHGLTESTDPEGKITTDYESDFNSEKDIANYSGEIAGEENEGSSNGEFEGDGTSDEAISESQIYIAKCLIGSIFNEYGISNQAIRKEMVAEAIHYIFKYGIENLAPSVADVSHLVVEQNKLSDLNGVSTLSAKYIVENTSMDFSENAVINIFEESNRIVDALEYSNTLLKEAKEIEECDTCEAAKETLVKGLIEESNQINEAVSTLLKANKIERDRQALRYRMNKFHEHTKSQVANNWVIVESNLSEAARLFKNELTIRRFVKEAVEIKEFFNDLQDENPLRKSTIKKEQGKFSDLAIAAICTEMALNWAALKKSNYNNRPLTEKSIVLETMIEKTNGYKRLILAVPNNKRGVSVVENFNYRLQSLKDKVDIKIKQS